MLQRQAHALRRFPNVALRSRPDRVVPQLHRTLATASPAKPPSPNDPFANGTNTYYVEEMYRLWRQDPKSVHVSWDVYFTGMDKKGLTSPQAFQPAPSVDAIPAGGAPSLHGAGGAELDDHLRVSTDLEFRTVECRSSRERSLHPHASSSSTCQIAIAAWEHCRPEWS